MATVVNKDFKIKNGLKVEGTTGTINNYDILTKKPDDQNYIIGLIGGSATPDATPDTVVLRDENADFSANMITSDLTGDVTGTVSDISNHDTDALSEGTTNKYFTNQRVRDVLTGSTQTNISITEISGELHITAENGVADSTTDDLDEGTTNKYYTDTRARQALSEGNGINYDNTTGTISADLGDFDTNNLTEGSTNKYFTDTRAKDAVAASLGDGIEYANGSFDVQFSSGITLGGGTGNELVIDRTETDNWYDANGAAGDVQDNLNTHTNASSGVHGVTGSVVGTSDTQELSNKTFVGTIGLGAENTNDAYIQTETDGGGNLTVHAGADLTLSTSTGDIVLNADGGVYVGSVSAGNTVATNSYVDNAVSGLDWKNAVHLLYDAAIPVLSGSGASQLTIDGHDPLGDADSGYRILLAAVGGATTDGIYVFNSTGGSWTLTRATDADTYQELIGAAVYVMEGTTYGGSSWVQSSHYLTDFTGQNWTQFSGAGTVTAGNGITVNGLEVSIDRTTVDTWYDENGAAQDAVNDHSALTFGVHGVTGDVVGTSDQQTLTNKTIDGGDNTLQNIPNAALDNDSITVNGYATALGDSVTLNTSDVAEGTNEYFTQTRARQSLSGGTAINYDNTTGVIAVDATQLDTGDIAEGTNLYYTDGRVKNVLTSATQNNIVIEEIGGQLIITAENGVEDSTTDDLEEGITNHYFTENRAKDAAGYLLENASQTNISITYDEVTRTLSVNAENGVADSTTDDLDEGTNNLYFTDIRAVEALEAVVPNFTEVDINSLATQIAATTGNIATASTITAYQFAKADYRSAKFLVKCGYGAHTEISEVILTLDTSDNIAITEYATIGTNGPTMTVSADIDGANVRLRVATVNNNSVVTVVGTLLV